MKITQQLDLDTDSEDAQEAKRLGINVSDAIKRAVSETPKSKESAQAINAADEARRAHMDTTGWWYRKSYSHNYTPHWSYCPRDGVEVRIYDQEETP